MKDTGRLPHKIFIALKLSPLIFLISSAHILQLCKVSSVSVHKFTWDWTSRQMDRRMDRVIIYLYLHQTFFCAAYKKNGSYFYEFKTCIDWLKMTRKILQDSQPPYKLWNLAADFIWGFGEQAKQTIKQWWERTHHYWLSICLSGNMLLPETKDQQR